jgi:hypothetical protein
MADVMALLEDDERRTEAMATELQERFPDAATVFFDNAPDMVEWLRDNLPAVRLLCLDHDLGPTRQRDGKLFDPGIGRDVVDFLTTQQPSCPVLIHSTNTRAVSGMLFALEEAGWSASDLTPFDDLAWVKLLWSERVAALLSESQASGGR